MFRLGLSIVFVLILFSCSNNAHHSRKKFKDYWVESDFVDDSVFNGLTKFYNEKNVLQHADYYVHGVKNGPSVSYHSNGKVYDSVNYFYGFRNGYRFVYDSSGELGRKQYYYMDRRLGPDVVIHGNVVTSYDFTDFNEHALYSYISVSPDSIKRKGEIIYATPYQQYDGDSLNSYVFLYLLHPPKMSVIYELVAQNSQNKESHIAYFTNDFFSDTLVASSNDKRRFFIKASVFDSLEKGNQKVYYSELMFNQYPNQ